MFNLYQYNFKNTISFKNIHEILEFNKNGEINMLSIELTNQFILEKNSVSFQSLDSDK